jgi:hypothetical protein
MSGLKEEEYNLKGQMWRAKLSMTNNIACPVK